MPDIVEAYVGAMFIDADFDYGEVQRFFDEHMKPFFEDMEIYDDYANNHPVVSLESRIDKPLKWLITDSRLGFII